MATTSPVPAPVALTGSGTMTLISVVAELSYISQYFDDTNALNNPPAADKTRLKSLLDQSVADLQAVVNRLKTQIGQDTGGGQSK